MTSRSAHIWLRYHYPKSGVCEDCGREVGTRRPNGTHYAFKRHGQPRTRNREDYLELCPPCHFAMDHQLFVEAGRCGAHEYWRRRREAA